MAQVFSRLANSWKQRSWSLFSKSTLSGSLVLISLCLFVSQLGIIFSNWRVDPPVDLAPELDPETAEMAKAILSDLASSSVGFVPGLSTSILEYVHLIYTNLTTKLTFSNNRCQAYLQHHAPELSISEQLRSCMPPITDFEQQTETRPLFEIVANTLFYTTALSVVAYCCIALLYSHDVSEVFTRLLSMIHTTIAADVDFNEPEDLIPDEFDIPIASLPANESVISDTGDVPEPSTVSVPSQKTELLESAPVSQPAPVAQIVPQRPTALIDEEHVRAIALASSAATAELSNALLRQLQVGLQGNNREIELLKGKIMEVAQTAKSDSRNLQGRLNRGGDVRRELEKLKEATGRLWQWVYQLSQDLQLANFDRNYSYFLYLFILDSRMLT